MCGVTGFIAAPGFWPEHAAESVRQMAATLYFRGPDDSGVWVDGTCGVALAHRRLAIQDLSPAGHQPMSSSSGRYVVVFNGEIYNHLDLRAQLEPLGDTTVAIPWRGHSDTETLLAGIERWGIELTLQKAVGMFAMAIWDRDDKVLTLARDRMGEKPLYYGWVQGALVFGSELKALRAFPGFDNPVERRALALYMRHNYVPTPWSIYQNIWKLPQGSWVQFHAGDGLQAQGKGGLRTYWSLHDVAVQGLNDPFVGTDKEAIDSLEHHLKTSLSGQMMADVPLGAFLSGGIDSTTIVALMQSMSSQPVKTFTIGFHEGEYDEAQHAKTVAKHLGTDHTEWYITPKDALSVIPKLPELYDEPFADSSQVPTHLVSKLARKHVTVSLSGDAGDELFGGYNRYFWTMSVWRKLSRLPLAIRGALASGATSLSPEAWNKIFNIASVVLPDRLKYSNPGDKVHKAASLFGARRPEDIYLKLVSHWDDPAKVVLGVQEPATPVTDPSKWLAAPDIERRMMYLDMCTYLPDDILVKVDRAAMGVSLETRVPLLDHRLIEFAWKLPLSMKIRDGQGKWILRQLLYKHVPQELMDRPKMGFGVPIDQWLRGPLREWSEDLLTEDRLKNDGFFDSSTVRAKWSEHLSGKRNWAYYLWDVLMYQAWLESNSA